MDSSDAIQVLILLILIGLSAFFSSSETAMVTVNKIRVRNLVEEGDNRAVILSKIIEDQGKMLSALLIGNNCQSFRILSGYSHGYRLVWKHRSWYRYRRIDIGNINLWRNYS